ncbi:Rap1a/Tai family immunity protein [Pseudomonas sp. P2757]
MARIAAAVALAWTLASGIAVADGNRLLNTCLSAIRFDETKLIGDELGTGFCLGMMQGVRSLIWFSNTNLPRGHQTCLPSSGISNAQAAKIVVKYLRTHPDQLPEDEGILTLMALRRAYPCM